MTIRDSFSLGYCLRAFAKGWSRMIRRFRGIPCGCVLSILHAPVALEMLLGLFGLPQLVEDERQVILGFHVARIGCQSALD